MGVCIKFNVVASPLRGLATLLPRGLIAGGSPRGLIALVTRGNGSPGGNENKRRTSLPE